MSYRATSTTTGRPGIGERRDYVYRGTKTLENDPEVSRKPRGAIAKAAAERRDRIARFAVILAGLDPRPSPSRTAILEAGRLVGVGPGTAGDYARTVRRQREQEASS